MMAGTLILFSLPIITLFAFIADMPKVGSLLAFVTLTCLFLILR